MNNYTELKKRCNAFDEGFEDCKQLAWDWGTSQKHIKTMMLEIMESSPDGIAMEYEAQNSNLYLLAEVFQNSKAMTHLKTKGGSALTARALEVLSFWEGTPGFWCYFSVKEKLATDFFLIEDHLSRKEHILYSKGVSTMQKLVGAEEVHYLCMMLPNEGCLQTVGVIKPYRFPVSDFTFYCSLFKPQRTLKTILSKHFISFFKVDAIANIPMLHYEGHYMGFAWTSFSLAEFDILQLGGDWIAETLGTQQRFALDSFDSTMDKLPNRRLFETTTRVMAGDIFRDPATGEMGIMANTEAAYPFYSALLNRAYPELKLPKKPEIFVSAVLQSHLIERDFPFTWKKFKKLIEYESEKEDSFKLDLEKLRQEFDKFPEDDPIVQQTKELLDMFLESKNTGKPLDIDALVKVTNLEREDIEAILNGMDENSSLPPFDMLFGDDDDFFDGLEESYEISSADKKLELKNLPIVDDSDGESLYLDLAHSKLFMVNGSKKAEKQFIETTTKEFSEEIRKYGFLDSIEELFSEFGELDFPLMNIFFWLLLHKGKKWVPLRSYAIEMLKWIPSLIFEEYADEDDFITDFSLFCVTTLAPIGICSLTEKPNLREVKMATYKIQGTEAFFSLVKTRA